MPRNHETLDPGRIMAQRQREAIVSVGASGGGRAGSKSIQYKQLVAEALQMTSGTNKTLERMKQAEETLRAAIKLCPERRDAHGILAQMLILWDADAAAIHYSRTEALSTARDELWAKAAVSVFEYVCLPAERLSQDGSPAQLVLPTWCHDDGLKQAATDALALLPDFEWRAVRMHALVLSGEELLPCGVAAPKGGSSMVRERTPAELCAAAASCQKLVKLIGLARSGSFPVALGPEDRVLLQVTDATLKRFIELALCCRRLASMLEEDRGATSYAELRRRAGFGRATQGEKAQQPQRQLKDGTSGTAVSQEPGMERNIHADAADRVLPVEPTRDGLGQSPIAASTAAAAYPAAAASATDTSDKPAASCHVDAMETIDSAKANETSPATLMCATTGAVVVAAAAWAALQGRGDLS